MQLEEQLDGEVVEVAAVLDDLDEGRQPTLARGQRGHGDGGVELPDHFQGRRDRNISVHHRLHQEKEELRMPLLIPAVLNRWGLRIHIIIS